MRQLLIFIGTVLLFQFCSRIENKNEEKKKEDVKEETFEEKESLITPKSIGLARLGQTIAAFKQTFKDYELTTVPVWNYCVDGGGNGILVSKDKEVLLFVWTMPGSDSIHSITGLSKQFRTKEGLGPTTSVRQLMKQYPSLTLVNDMLCEGLEFFWERKTGIKYEFISNDSTRIGHYTNDITVSVPFDTVRRINGVVISLN